MKARIWPILIFGFGALIVLVGLSGCLAYVRAKSTYIEISELYQAEHRAQQSLTQVRYDSDRSAILLRDFLLDPKLAAEVAESEMDRLRTSTQIQLALLPRLVPASLSGQLPTLRRQVAEYWASLDPVLTGGRERSQLGLSLLQTRIRPHRQAALGVVAEVQKLSSEAFQVRRNEIDRKNLGLGFYLGELVGVTLLTAVLVAGASVLRIYSLERIAEFQHRQVQEAEINLRRLSQQMVHVQEEERRSLSRELHDQIGQILTAMRISLGNLEKSIATHEGSSYRELELSKRLVVQALRSTRDLAMGLRPAMLDDLGLEAALEWYARQHAKLYGIPVAIEVHAPLDKLSDGQKTCVYRIVQEALNNSAKYAQASHVSVSLLANGSSVTLRIIDDGSGFDISGDAARGLGLLGMRERIAQLGGTLVIHSTPDEGTRISADLPLVEVSL